MTARARNVLLITADQWRGDCLSALQHPCLRTPQIDRLIGEGAAFANHYSVCAPCGPARASLLTGMYLQNHRSVRNGTPLDDRHSNIARELRRAGYRPTLFGYTDTSLDPRHYPERQVRAHGYENLLPGFEEGLLLPGEAPQAWLDYLREAGYDFADLQAAYRPADVPDKGRGRTWAPARYRAQDSQTAFLTRRARDYIDNCSPGWFVHLSYLRPHPPFLAPAPYHDMYDPADVPAPVRAESPAQQAGQHPWLAAALGRTGDWFDPWMRELIERDDYDRQIRQVRATYYGLISKVDVYIGELLDFLRARGDLDNTLIVVTSDHGELLGDQWLFGKRGFFDSGFHIPLILRAPGFGADGGRIHDAFTESVDLMPTILDWLGLALPRQCDGRSLLPLLDGNVPSDWRREVHWEFDFRDVLDPRLERDLGIAMDDCQLNVIRNRRYKYVHFTALPPLFFDLETDPAQCRNLAEDPRYAGEMLELCRQLLSWRMRNDERTLTAMQVSRDGVRTRD